MEDTMLRTTPPKASLEQDPNLLKFRSTAVAAPKILISRCCGEHRMRPLGTFGRGVDGCCRGSAATAKDRLRKPMDVRWGNSLCRCTLPTHCAPTISSESPYLGALLALAEARNEKRPAHWSPGIRYRWLRGPATILICSSGHEATQPYPRQQSSFSRPTTTYFEQASPPSHGGNRVQIP